MASIRAHFEMPSKTRTWSLGLIAIGAVALIIGFVTKKYDRLLAILLLGFHFMSWLIMDIAPFGQVGFISLLFLSRQFQTCFGIKS